MKNAEEIIGEIDRLQPEMTLQSDFFSSLRSDAKKGVKNLGIPNAKQEAYKYSNPSKLIKPLQVLNPSSHISELSIDTDVYNIPGLETTNISLVNGIAVNAENLPNGVNVSSLLDAYKQHPELVMKVFEMESREDMFELLNISILSNAVFIHVQKGAIVKETLQLINLLHTSEGSLTSSNIILYVDEGAICKFIERQTTSDVKGELVSHACRIFVEKNSNLEYYLLQIDERLKLINNYNVQLHGNVVFRTNTITLNAEWIRNNLSIFIKGEHVETHLDGVYVVDKEQHLDNHTLVNHDLPNCESHQLYKGLLGGKATGVFNGRIYVRKDAQKTNAYQSSKNILLSDNSTINTKPELEIYADDVKCSHGSSTGKLDEEAMFYLHSRGLGETSAKKMLLQAFANDVLNKIQIEELREYLSNLIGERIGSLEM